MNKKAQDSFNYMSSDLFDEYEDMSIKDFSESFDKDIDYLETKHKEEIESEFDEAKEEIGNFFDDMSEEHGPRATIGDIVPGSDRHVMKEDEEEYVEKNYPDDGNLEKFHEYLAGKYEDIPRHDGESVAGCERAVVYLDKLNREISKNIREDDDHVLDIDVMSDYQQKIMRDIIVLKDHIKKLKRKFKETAVKEDKTAIDDSAFVKEAAGTIKLYVCITPFTRAICGILINSVVSAGKPFDKVYDYLVGKYDITAREELAILQVLMDMGQPVFKDRGSLPIPEEAKDKSRLEALEEDLSGVDFITNYFA